MAADSTMILVSHGLGAAAHLALAALILTSWRRHPLNRLLLAGVLAGLVWSLAPLSVPQRWTALVAEVLAGPRLLAWTLFLCGLARMLQPHGALPSLLRVSPWAAAAASLLGIALDWVPVAALAQAIIGLMLVETVLTGAPEPERWAIKPFAVGLGGMFAYEFLLYADAVLFGRVSGELALARGAVGALTLGFVGIAIARSTDWAPRIHVSRRIAIGSAAVLGAGLYLMIMAAAGFHVRRIGGDWGDFLRILLIFTAISLLASLTLSGKARGLLRRFVVENFYSHRHDYRREWQRFIEALSTEGDRRDLGQRVTRAIADVLDVPEGALWLATPDGVGLAAGWNTSRWRLHGSALQLPGDDPLLRRMRDLPTIIELDRLPPDDRPAWLSAVGRAWLAVPLPQHGRLVGFVVLGRPRVPRRLAQEDRDLVGMLARQSASYLLERTQAEELADMRRFATFTRRVTFATHDLKNVSSQLGLLLANARRCRSDPAFIDDMLETVGHAVERTNLLLRRLGGAVEDRPEPVDLAEAMARAVTRAGGAARGVRLAHVAGARALVEPFDFTACLDHLVQNALEAAGATGMVELEVRTIAGQAVLVVRDSGPGMAPDLLAAGTLRPFRSTKPDGYGVGILEVRDFARRSGGRLEIDSAPGRGTEMRLVLPLATEASALSAPPTLPAASPATATEA